jgi:hypothetical protein
MWTDLLLLAPAVIVFLILIGLSRRGVTPAPPPADAEGPPRNAIVVDGSNVMFWGGDPSLNTLARILRSLEAADYAPIVFFDASVGYKVGERYYDELAIAPLIGIRFDRICVVSKGVIADQSILMFATDHKLRIVTNDRYRDWSVQFPIIKQKGRLVRGAWKNGNVTWQRSLRRKG